MTALPEIESKINAVAQSFESVQRLAAHVRSEILLKISRGIEKESEAIARLICQEVFKPIKDARKEVARAVFTFGWAGRKGKTHGRKIVPA